MATASTTTTTELHTPPSGDTPPSTPPPGTAPTAPITPAALPNGSLTSPEQQGQSATTGPNTAAGSSAHAFPIAWVAVGGLVLVLILVGVYFAARKR